MGVLVKIILFFLVFFWVFKVASKVVMSWFFKQSQQSSHTYRQRTYQKTSRSTSGSVDVDRSSGQTHQRKKTTGNFKGGDYIDYEEVK